MLKLGLIFSLICISRLNAMELQGMRISGSYIPIEKDEPGNTESPLDNEIFPQSEVQKEELTFGDGTVPKELRDFVSQFMPYAPDLSFISKKAQKMGKKKPRKMKKVKFQEPIETIIEGAHEKPAEVQPPMRIPTNTFGSIMDVVVDEFPDTGKLETTPTPTYPKPTKTRRPPSLFSLGNIFRTVMPFITNANPLSQFMSIFNEPTTTPKPTKPTPKTTTEPQLPNFFSDDQIPQFVHIPTSSSDHEYEFPSFYSSSFDQQSPLSQFIQIFNDPKLAKSTSRRNMDSDFPLPDIIMDAMRQAYPEGNVPWKIQVGEGEGEDAGEMVVNIEPVMKRQGLEKTMIFNVPMQIGRHGNDDDVFNIFDLL